MYYNYVICNSFQDREGVKPFHEDINISDKTWEKAYQAFHMTEATISRVGSKNSNRFVFYKNDDEALINSDFLSSKFSKLRVSFDELMELNLKFPRIDLNRSDWAASRCCCSYFLKNYFCSDVIAIASNAKLVTIPDIHKNVPIGQKTKRGRKPKARKALQHQ